MHKAINATFFPPHAHQSWIYTTAAYTFAADCLKILFPPAFPIVAMAALGLGTGVAFNLSEKYLIPRCVKHFNLNANCQTVLSDLAYSLAAMSTALIGLMLFGPSAALGIVGVTLMPYSVYALYNLVRCLIRQESKENKLKVGWHTTAYFVTLVFSIVVLKWIFFSPLPTILVAGTVANLLFALTLTPKNIPLLPKFLAPSAPSTETLAATLPPPHDDDGEPADVPVVSRRALVVRHSWR